MQYALTIYDDQSKYADAPPEAPRKPPRPTAAFTQGMRAAGVLLGGERAAARRRPRRPCASATASGSSPTARSPRPRSSSAASTSSTCRPRRGDRRGRPRSRAPHGGSIEVRPVMDYDDARTGAERSGRRLSGSGSLERLFRRESGQAVAALDPRRSATSTSPRSGPGRVRARSSAGRATASRANPAAWLIDHRAQRAIDRLRRERAARREASRELRGARARDERRGRGADEHDPGRPAAADLHLLPPGARAGGAGRADAAHARRPRPPPRSRARSSCPSRRWRSGWCAPRRKIRDAGIPYERARATHELPDAPRPCSRRSTWSSTRATPRPRATRSCARELVRARRSGSAASLAELMPDEPEALGLLALMLLHDSRRDGPRRRRRRARPARGPGPRALGPRAIAEGVGAARARARARRPGPYQLQAAIAVDATAPTAATPTGRGSPALYDAARALDRRPVVELNRAVAVAMADGPRRARARRRARPTALAGYHLLHAARADLLRRLGRRAEARAAYDASARAQPATPERALPGAPAGRAV